MISQVLISLIETIACRGAGARSACFSYQPQSPECLKNIDILKEVDLKVNK